MGTGMVEESSSATAATPQIPIFITAGRATTFHQAAIRTKNCFKQVPFRPAHPSIHKELLYGAGPGRTPAVFKGFCVKLAGFASFRELILFPGRHRALDSSFEGMRE